MNIKTLIRKEESKDMTEEGISATEKFQRVFLRTFEDFEKTPSNIDEIFLSNITHRVFSYPIYTSIDKKTNSFFKEKIYTRIITCPTSNEYDYSVVLGEDLTARSKKIGVQIANSSETSVCNVHILPTEIRDGYNVREDLYFFTVPPKTLFPFQFDAVFSSYTIKLRQQSAPAEVHIKVNYVPL